MNLTSLGSFSSLATSAFDTARSTFKGLADAAIGEPGADTTADAGQAPAGPARRADRTPEAKFQGRVDATESVPTKGRRLGSLLDAYA